MTTSDYLTQLQQDKQDLVDNLTEKGITGLTGDETFTELVPEVLNIQSIPVPKSQTEFNQVMIQIANNYDNYLNSLPENYEAYSNNPITLYSPKNNFTKYMIQKTNADLYRIVWSNQYTYPYMIINSNSSQGFRGYEAFTAGSSTLSYATRNISVLASYFFPVSLKNRNNKEFYYSSNFSTMEELLQALQDSAASSITYTKWTNGSDFSGVIDENFTVPYTNCPIFDANSNLISNGKIISHDETIVEPSE